MKKTIPDIKQCPKCHAPKARITVVPPLVPEARYYGQMSRFAYCRFCKSYLVYFTQPDPLTDRGTHDEYVIPQGQWAPTCIRMGHQDEGRDHRTDNSRR